MVQSLDAIMGDGNPALVEQPAPEGGSETQGQPRDEAGRFAGQPEGDQQPQPGQQPGEQPGQPEEGQPPAARDGFVPQQALHAARQELKAERDRYEALERQVQALQQRMMAPPQQPQQPPPAPPEFWDAPEEAVRRTVNDALTPVQQALMFNARLTATSVHGQETVEKAVQEFDRLTAAGQIDPRDQARVMQSPNPFHEAVQWHQRNSALSKYGTDPEAFINAEVERRMAERAQQQPAAQPQAGAPAPGGPMPTSFTAARNAGPRAAVQYSGPKPLSEILGR